MQDSSQELLRTALDDAHLTLFAQRLTAWLLAEVGDGHTAVETMDSRARALLRAADLIDAPTLRSFSRLTSPAGLAHDRVVRLALYDLLHDCRLASEGEVTALAAVCQSSPAPDPRPEVAWFALTVAAFAWKAGYSIQHLDPASPPEEYSPAGQLLRRAAHFLRRQTARSATERDKLGRKLSFDPLLAQAGTTGLDALPDQPPIAPLPPHFRPPVPVNYPEVASETLAIDASEAENTPAAASRQEPLKISEQDLPAPETAEHMPPVRIAADQIEGQTPPRSQLVTPAPSTPPGNFTRAVRSRFGRGREPLTTTKLRVLVQETAEGTGLYGLQVRVTCKGVRSYVAGTTNRQGTFLCELPVRMRSGLTYDVDVTWPRDMGGGTERKSITLNADRTEFTLPFYQRLR